jgi:hypothetical protein
MVVILAQVFAGRLHVDQQRHLVAMRLPVVDVELDADMAGNGVDVDGGVGRAADRRVDDDGVDEGLGQDVGGLEVLVHHLDDAHAGAPGHFLAVAIGRRDGGGPGSCMPSASASEFMVEAVPMVLQ